MRPVLPRFHGCCEPAVQAQPASLCPWHCCRGTGWSALSHSLLPLCHRQSTRKWTVTTLVPSTPMRCGMPSERQVSVLLGDTIGSPNIGRTEEHFNGFSSLLSLRSQHCQCHSPFLTVTHCYILLLLNTSNPILCSALWTTGTFVHAVTIAYPSDYYLLYFWPHYFLI